MKSPLGKITNASLSTPLPNSTISYSDDQFKTPNNDRHNSNNQNGDIINNNVKDGISDLEKRAKARAAALQEAESVLRAVSSGGGSKATFPSAIGTDNTNNSMNRIAENDGSDSAQPTATATASSPPPPPPSDSPIKFTPRSRSDAVAAAKRRAEERKRAASGITPKVTANSKHPSQPSLAGEALSSIGTNDATSSSHPPPSSLTPNPNHPSSNQMDWFNLLGVVANPGYDSWHGAPTNNAASSSSSSHNSRSRHGGRVSRHGLSSHGTPISLDHVGSDGTRGGSQGGDTYAASIFAAAGLPEWAGYANTTSASASSTMNNVASGLDEITGWFDHYSRKYLGTVPGIDGGSLLLGEGDGDGIGGAGGIVGGMGLRGGSSSAVWEDYEPEFGPEDIPELQLEELPREISDLDLGSVERFLRVCGMLGMRFEDRGGGFHAMRNRDRGRKELIDGEGDHADNQDTTSVLASSGEFSSNPEVAQAIESVPEIFFSPYFDLTDPVCFENLLVVGDDEVAQIRAKEAEMHALADQKVREAEEVAKRDAENQILAPRPPPRHAPVTLGPEGMGSLPNQSGTSLTKDAKATSRPSDGNVITLRKPETFTSHLDAIELALLDQVRSKSDRFFRETNRFSELQKLVTESVDEVRVLRTELQSLRERCVTNVELVPLMDDSRRDLRDISHVLEGVEDVVNCKSSIASLMSAGDHLGAVEAIRLARSLLAGTPDENDDAGNNSGIGETTDSSALTQPQHRLCLGKLRAFSKVGEQFNEYEKLVVRNLTDELVETFLSWGSERGALGDDGGSGTTSGSVDYRSTPRVTLSSERRAKVRGVVHSLRLCGQMTGAGVAYQKKLCELLSVTVKAIVTECVADAAGISGGGTDASTLAKGTMAGVATISLDQFLDCINMLFEQVLGLLWGAVAVNKFCIDEGIILDDSTHSTDSKTSSSVENCFSGEASQHTPSATATALAAAADLSEKSVSELLRLRREAHSLVSFDGMRQLWDTSLTFTLQLEKFSGRKAYGLRSTLLAQAKSFVERKHEANMSTLVAALDSERWVQCNVSVERQAALTRLCSGRAAFSSRKLVSGTTENIASPGNVAPASGREKMADAEVEGARFKVVWSCLLLLEMVMDDVACAAHFQTLATNVVGKVSELFRLFNSRSTHLVFGAGAIHSAARLKSINAKHLAIVTQCIALVLAILPHVRAALMAQLPSKQHSLLNELDKIKGEYTEHSEKILNKLVSIIGGIVEHSLASKIVQSNFDTRAKSAPSLENKSDFIIQCCPFLDSVITNTKKMHQVLNMMLPPDLLQDVFSRIFAYLDHKVPSLFKIAASSGKKGNPPAANFSMPCTDDGKLQMVREVEHMTKTLNSLSGVQPWNFTAMKVLEQELDIRSPDQSISQIPVEENNGDQPDVKSDEKKEMDEDDQSVTGSAEKQAPVPVDVSNDQDIGLNEEIGRSSSIVSEVDDKVNISKQDSKSVNIDIANSSDYNETNGVHPSESKIPEGDTIACTKGGDSVVGTDTSVDKEGEDGGIIADSAGVDQNDAIVNGGMP